MVVRNDSVKVKFVRNTHDSATLMSYYAGDEATLTDVEALRLVDAGHAEYATKAQAKKVGEDPEENPERVASKKK